jgi:hypothetical protein|tara:strand:+ start:2662 stop:2901 length:240 start_codon:yes stop_codon:yes gene_type:complete
MTQFEVGQLVRAHLAMGKGVDGHVEPGDVGIVAELYHKPPHKPPSPEWQIYRVKWLTKAAFGLWWMRPEHILPLNRSMK